MQLNQMKRNREKKKKIKKVYSASIYKIVYFIMSRKIARKLCTDSS